MKIAILASMICLASGMATAQTLKVDEVPEPVKKTFAEKFANAKEVKWLKEDTTEFEAEFEMNGKEQSANFDSSGTWLVTEIKIKKSELPGAVQTTLAKEFVGYKIEEAEKAETANHGSFYEVEVKNGKLKFEVQLSSNGKVMKKEEVKEKSQKD